MVKSAEKTNIRGCYIIKSKRFGDNRGWFSETFSKREFENLGLPSEYPQGNLSMSIEEGTFRGMHFQKDASVQGKLVSCTAGIVIDYIFDARVGSPTYGQSLSVELNGNSMEPTIVYVPEGCLHGFYVKEGPAYFSYQVTNYYDGPKDGGVLCTDPELNLDLPSGNFILSKKDQEQPLLKDANLNFKYSPRCLVTGAINGQLGPDVVVELKKRGIKDVFAVDKEIMDITDEAKVKEVVDMYNPDIIFHCAAYTEVDAAQKKPELAKAINEDGTRYIVEAAKKCKAKLIYISTDYVFDGTNLSREYEVTDIPNPQSVYGQTKFAGEEAVKEYDKSFIVRTSWVFGGINTKNFVKTMLSLFRNVPEVTVVNDQFGSPTYTKDLAKFLVDLSQSEKYGIYHANNEGFCSWYDFACKIFALAGYAMNVKPVSTEEYYGSENMLKKIRVMLAELGETVGREISIEDRNKVIAPRPLNSRLSKDSISDNGFERLRPWQDAAKAYVLKLQASEDDK